MELMDIDAFTSLMACTSPYSLEHNAQLVNTKRGFASYSEPRLVFDNAFFDELSPGAMREALSGYERAYLNTTGVPEHDLVSLSTLLAQVSLECRVLACRMGIPLDAVQDAIAACELQDIPNKPAVSTALFGVAS